jgi:glycosyltransferase involved in cell wall biosynthesis
MRFGFVSTYPPTQCGLATFTSSLMTAMIGRQDHAGYDDTASVIRLLEFPAGPRGFHDPAAEVVGTMVGGDPRGPAAAAMLLSNCDVVVIQHEYGIFGGQDGDEVLSLLAELRVPSIVVLHTVLTTPTDHQRQVLESVVRLASAAVTMTSTARDRLVAGYRIDPAKVQVIPHGSADIAGRTDHAALTARPVVLTWGLIGPGKGIEWGIEAMSRLRDLRPEPQYVVAGQTHPKVRETAGEAYRDGLRDRIHRLGLESSVQLDGRYRNNSDLAALVRSASVVLLPYDSTEQVTSGVLIEAVAAQRPVVATRFPHAVELLAGGAGILVPQRDPAAMAEALRAVLTSESLAATMTRAAASQTAELLWPAVAQRYRDLAADLIRAEMAA